MCMNMPSDYERATIPIRRAHHVIVLVLRSYGRLYTLHSASLQERPCRCMEEEPALTNLAAECVPSSALVSLCPMNFPLLTMFVCLLSDEPGDGSLMPLHHRRPCENRHR